MGAPVNLEGYESFKVNASLNAVIDSLAKLIFTIVPGNKAWFYRLAGARIGKGSVVYGRLVEPDLIIIGENCVVASGAILSGHVIDRGKCYFNKIIVGNNCLVGANSIVTPGVVLEDNVTVGAGCFVPKNKRIKKGETVVSSKLITLNCS